MNSPPCLGHNVECLRGPCCPSGVLLIVLRGSGPSVPGFTGICQIYPRPGFSIKNCIHSLTTTMSSKDPPKSTKITPETSPETNKNTKFPKHEMLPKPLYLLWFEHIRPPLGDTLGIKNAFRHRHTDIPSNFSRF